MTAVPQNLPLFSQPNKTRPLSQLEAVRAVLADGRPRTLPQIHLAVEALRGKKCTDSAISARIRDLRKREHGGLVIKSWALAEHEGLWAYRLCKTCHNKINADSQFSDTSKTSPRAIHAGGGAT